MFRRLSKKVSKVFRKKDGSDELPPTIAERDHRFSARPETGLRSRRFSTPERSRVYTSYDPYLATLPEDPQPRRPLGGQTRRHTLPATALNTNGDEDL
jgi:hypothetical protein